MQDLKKIQLKSGFCLFLLVMIQLALLFPLLRETLVSELANEIEQDFWTFFNILTVISLLMALNMGKSAINEILRVTEINYIGITTLFQSSVFILCNSSLVFYIYCSIFYENGNFFHYLGQGFLLCFVSIFVGLIMIIPSLVLGKIYSGILEKMTQPLLNPNHVI